MLELAMELKSGQVDGFTVSAHTGETVSSGYVVGGDPECREVRLKDFRDIPSDLLVAHLEHYRTVAEMYGRGMVGGWVHEGDLYLDAPSILWDPEEAEALARVRGELAYFNLDTMTEHMIND